MPELEIIASAVELRAMSLCHALQAAGEDVPAEAFESHRSAAGWLQVWCMRTARDIIGDANARQYAEIQRVKRSLVVPMPVGEQIDGQEQDEAGHKDQLAAVAADAEQISGCHGE